MQSFKEFITEDAYPFTIEQIEEKYKKYNAELFGNRLPTIPIVFGERDDCAAVLNSTVIKHEDGSFSNVDIKSLEFSTKYAPEGDQLDSILVHEMIHVATVEETFLMGDGEEHDDCFYLELERIKKMVPFDIPRI